MENKDNDKFEKTQDFLDLMTRSERKAWERAQKEEQEKLALATLEKETSTQKKKKEKNQEEKLRKEILKDKEPLKRLEETQEMNTEGTEDLQVGELSKTQHFLNLTSELAITMEDNVQDNLFEKEKQQSSFNPITWIGLAIILCFGYFIYLVIHSGYDETRLLLIDSCFLLGIILLFGISILSNKKWTKRFSILNLFIIIAFIGTNVFFLYDWDIHKEKEVIEEEPIETKIKKELTCISEDKTIKQVIQAEENLIEKITFTQNFTDEEELKAILEIFEEVEGLSITTEENQLMLEFDFSLIDINQYKVMMRTYLEYYRNSSNFSYIDETNLYYTSYLETELEGYQCTEKEESIQ